MGYRLNRLDEPVFIAVSKPLLTEFHIHHRLESCGRNWSGNEVRDLSHCGDPNLPKISAGLARYTPLVN